MIFLTEVSCINNNSFMIAHVARIWLVCMVLQPPMLCVVNNLVEHDVMLIFMTW